MTVPSRRVDAARTAHPASRAETDRRRKGARPLLAVSLGCPSGIGPEVSVFASLKARAFARILLVGDPRIVRRVAPPTMRFAEVERPEDLTEDVGILVTATPIAPKDAPFGRPARRAGGAQYSWFEEAMTLVAQGHASALVTGPVSKAAVQSGGVRGFLGHTEALAERFCVDEVTMAFASEHFTTALVTTHLPIRDVPRAITSSRVHRAIRDLARYLEARRYLRAGKEARIVVTGLNPHAGERGKIGDEEERIERAVKLAAKLPGRIEGPIGAEVAFRRAAKGDVDGVVAMYHDQATIPTKVLSFGEAVNVTLGLPIVRTSVDHGTGYDIAGKGTADPSGMLAAMKLAAELVDQTAP